MIFAFIGAGAVFAAVLCMTTDGHRWSAAKEGEQDPLASLIQRLPIVQKYQQALAFKAKQHVCQYSAPQMFDILTLGLSAGLSFDASLDLYLARTHNALAKELFYTQMLWRLGEASRSDALLKLAERLDVAVIRRFASAVNEALLFGVPLAATLVAQSKDIRLEQKAEVEEAIEKIPVKLLIPLGTLVVPAMLLAIMGPLLAGAFM